MTSNRSGFLDSDGDLLDNGDARYAYDGNGQRIARDFAGGTADDLDYYYNEHWQVLEVRKGGSANPLERYIWDETYVDAPVTIERDVNTDGVRDQRLWATYDANYNVTSVLTDGGKLVERYVYTPYGTRTVLNGSSNYAGTGSDPDGADWQPDGGGDSYDVKPGHQGLMWDAETGQWQNRHRFMSSSLGVFTQRDPSGYADSYNLGEAYQGNPSGFTDPSGLESHGPRKLIPVTKINTGGRGGSYYVLPDGTRVSDNRVVIKDGVPHTAAGYNPNSPTTDRQVGPITPPKWERPVVNAATAVSIAAGGTAITIGGVRVLTIAGAQIAAALSPGAPVLVGVGGGTGAAAGTITVGGAATVNGVVGGTIVVTGTVMQTGGSGGSFDSDEDAYTGRNRKLGKHKFRGRDSLRNHNDQVNRISREEGLDEAQERILHDMITGENLSLETIRDIARGIVGKT